MNTQIIEKDLEQIASLNSFELSLLSSDLKVGEYLKMKMQMKVVAIAQANSMTDEEKDAVSKFDLTCFPIMTYVMLIEKSGSSLVELVENAITLFSERRIKEHIDCSALALIKKESNSANSVQMATIDKAISRLCNFLDSKSTSYSSAVVEQIATSEQKFSIHDRNKDKDNVRVAALKCNQHPPQTANEMMYLLADEGYKADKVKPVQKRKTVEFIEGDESTYPPVGVMVVVSEIPTLPAYFDRQSCEWMFVEIENGAVVTRSYLSLSGGIGEVYWHEIAYKG